MAMKDLLLWPVTIIGFVLVSGLLIGLFLHFWWITVPVALICWFARS